MLIFGINSLAFLQCVNISCYAECCTSCSKCICLSINQSVTVTCWYCVKMTQAMIMQSSLDDSSMTLVSLWLTSQQTSKGKVIPEEGAPRESQEGKICNFQPISCCISETVQDRCKVAVNT